METEVEYCTNREWVSQLIDDVPVECQDEVANEVITEALRAAERADALAGVTFVRAKGQRMLYHGWNGAHFTEKHGIFGTFSKLSPEQKKALGAATDAGMAAGTAYADRVNKQLAE